ncbi:MAG TPA: M48 family metallopeptidase [Acidimicrobiales bacterium]|nr:M48 family metallopeptidase [Acidimicrobiales bacterium]
MHAVHGRAAPRRERSAPAGCTAPVTPAVPYSVRVSPRAKHVRLTLSPHDGLTVVLPRGVDPTTAPGAIESRLAWLRRAQARLGLDDAALRELQVRHERPTQLALRALGETVVIEYATPSHRAAQARCIGHGPGRLLVTGRSADPDAIAAALRRYLARRARAALEPWLRRLAAARDIAVPAVVVRAQRTRWASCSARGVISLNRNLLFLPEPLVTCVLLHELCHRLELNHSPRFWRLLAEQVPDLAERDAELATAWKLVPRWAR